MNWREHFLAAREKAEERRELDLANQKTVYERFLLEQFRRLTGQRLDRSCIYEYNLKVSDLTLMYDKDRKGWRLEGVCPHCEMTVWSDILKTEADIGDMLNRFRPDALHLSTHMEKR